MRTRVKVAIQMKPRNVPGWPCINYDYDKELLRITGPLFARNPEIDFDLCKYTSLDAAKADYERDLEIYDGVLVLMMTNWTRLDQFYIQQSRTGLPVIVADVPYCGSGGMLEVTSPTIRSGGFPVPMVASLNYNDIADAAALFGVIKKMKETTILVVKNEVQTDVQQAAERVWGCKFVNRTSHDLMEEFDRIPDEQAAPLADKWLNEAMEVREPTRADVMQGAKLYYAMRNMMAACGANAVTIDCLELSYNNIYGESCHMYPCLAYYQMANDGEIGICEADIHSTLSAMLVQYLTGRPGYVSDPVIDTSSDQIIYSHCVACRKVYGKDDPRTCQYILRSHAEDKKGASVQVIFPCGEELTTVQISNTEGWASIHSARSCGNAGGENGCRSKLAAVCEAEKILENWMPQWHRITVFGNYRKQLKNLFKMKGYRIIEEDR